MARCESTATSLYKFWRLKCGNELDVSPIGKNESMDADAHKKMLSLLSDTIGEMKQKYGKWNIAWGDIHKVGRSGQLFPVGGAEFKSGDRDANFSESLFDVSSSEDPDHPGHYIADSGSMAMLLMFFHKDGIRSYRCTPWGQTTDPESPHHTDQGENLYAKRKMKPTWWTKAELMPNVESETKLTLP